MIESACSIIYNSIEAPPYPLGGRGGKLQGLNISTEKTNNSKERKAKYGKKRPNKF